MPGMSILKLCLPDFGFFSWPEPGVGAYVDVRRETLAYEEKLGLAFNGSEIKSDSWNRKIRKLMWRGAPMVEIRQVRPACTTLTIGPLARELRSSLVRRQRTELGRCQPR